MLLKKQVFIAALLAAASGGACAQPLTPATGWYALGGVGRSTIDAPGNPTGKTSMHIDTHDTGYKLGAGYRYSRHFGVEFGYQDLGQETFNYTSATSTGSGHVKVRGWSVAAVGLLPISTQVTLIGKIGAFRGQTKYKDTLVTAGTSQTFYSSPHSTTPLLGLGVQYKITLKWSLRAEYENFGELKVGNNAPKAKADLLSVSALYHF